MKVLDRCLYQSKWMDHIRLTIIVIRCALFCWCVYAYQCTWFAWIGAQCGISRQMIYGQLMMGSRNRGRPKKRCMYKDSVRLYCKTVRVGLGTAFKRQPRGILQFLWKIPKYLYKIIKSLYRYFICEIILKNKHQIIH